MSDPLSRLRERVRERADLASRGARRPLSLTLSPRTGRGDRMELAQLFPNLMNRDQDDPQTCDGSREVHVHVALSLRDFVGILQVRERAGLASRDARLGG